MAPYALPTDTTAVFDANFVHHALNRTSASSSKASEPSLGICVGSNSTCRLRRPADCSQESCTEEFTIIIFPFLALFFGVVSKPLSRFLHVPYTLFILVLGIIVGLIGCGTDLGLLGTSLRQWVHLNPPTIFFYVFLAPLIFEASFNTRWHVFKRLLVPILTAAFVIVTLQIGLIATFQQVVIQSPDWNWWAALMFGSMLSATDPISVTATLKALGASELLNTLIEGESLVNDGSAFVLFESFIVNVEDTDDQLSVGSIIGRIFKLSLGGMVMGVAFGIVALIILGLVYDEFEVETSLTVVVAFLGFWTAQAPANLSGVICNVASGLIISAFGRHLVTPAVRGPLEEFWELLSWIANTIVFVQAGVLLSAFIWSCSGDPHEWFDYAYIFAYYLFLQVIRFGLILAFKPVMSIGNKWLRWKEAIVVAFSGLRGAVSLILALEVGANEEIPRNISSRVVLWTTGIVGLSLLVNGFLIKPLIHYLKLDRAEKTREDFLERARAVTVQRSLMILDVLAVGTGLKSARWSYVVKNVLPEEWLTEGGHVGGYRNGLEQIMDNQVAGHRKSLELVRAEEREKIIHAQINRRLSTDIRSVPTSPGYTPRVSIYTDRASVAPLSPSPRVFAGISPSPTFGEREVAGLGVGSPGVAPLSLGVSAVGRQYSVDGPHRGSIEADILRYKSVRHGGSLESDLSRYRSIGPVPQPSQATIHKEVANLHRLMMSGEEVELSPKDREIRRRLLTSLLSQVRALSNASLVEFSVLHNLEEDIQLALDANEEGEDYDIFRFLDHRSNQGNKFFYQSYLRVIEGKRLSGESSITTALVVFGILTEILKEEILHESPIVQLQAEQLYEGAAALLNRLEALNPEAFEWVETQFAVYVTARKQDEVLEDLRASGIVDHQEHKTIHEELIEVRRRHLRSRHSIFHSHKARLPPSPKPRELIREHPLFSHLSSKLRTEVVDRYGELVHLKGGQPLKAEKGSLILVLRGAIRPMEQTLLPRKISSAIRRNSTAIEMALSGSPVHHNSNPHPNNGSDSSETAGDLPGDSHGFQPLASGAVMYWYFPAHSGFCGPSVAVNCHNVDGHPTCSVAHDRIVDIQFCCCEVAGSATVFTLPIAQVRNLAKESEEFRLEVTKALAREIVLESVADQRPYALSHFMDPLTLGTDVHTVVGRAFRVLERLPYMTVQKLHEGDSPAIHVQGPGVLLNGTVRVSIVDTSGLVGAVNLLHEELTGPALLPAGGLIIQDVETLQFANESNGSQSERDREVAETVADVLEANTEENKANSRAIAHVLVENITEADETALLRLKRWSDAPLKIDMNGRFGMFRRVELSPLRETKIQ